MKGMTYQRLSEKEHVMNTIRKSLEKDWAVYSKRKFEFDTLRFHKIKIAAFLNNVFTSFDQW